MGGTIAIGSSPLNMQLVSSSMSLFGGYAIGIAVRRSMEDDPTPLNSSYTGNVTLPGSVDITPGSTSVISVDSLVIVEGDLTVPANSTLILQAGSTLIIHGDATVSGTVATSPGAVLEVSGNLVIANNSTLSISSALVVPGQSTVVVAQYNTVSGAFSSVVVSSSDPCMSFNALPLYGPSSLAVTIDSSQSAACSMGPPSRLSTGQLVGIIVGASVGVLVIVAIVVGIIVSKKKSQKSMEEVMFKLKSEK